LLQRDPLEVMIAYENHQERLLQLVSVYQSLPTQKMKTTFEVFVLERPSDPISALMARMGISQATAYRQKNRLFQHFGVSGD